MPRIPKGIRREPLKPEPATVPPSPPPSEAATAPPPDPVPSPPPAGSPPPAEPTRTEQLIQKAQEAPGSPLALTSDADPVRARLDRPADLERPRSDFRNINLDRLDTPEGVDQVLDAVSISTENAGYKPRPWEEMRKEAGDIPERELIAKLMKRKPGELLNDAQLTRARSIMVASAERLHQWGQELRRRGRAGVTDLELVEYQRALYQHSALQSSVQGATRETARALNALKAVPDRLDPQAIRDAMNGGGGPDAIFQKAVAIADAPTVEEASKRARQMSGLRKAAENLVYYRTMSLLSGPRTHVVNAVSNSLVNLVSMPERAVAGLISQTVGSGQVYAGESVEMFYGQVSNSLDALRFMRKAWVTGDSVYGGTKIETDSTIHSASEYGLESSDPGAIAMDYAASFVSAPGRALTAADEFFKTMAFNQQARALAYRVARQEGFTGPALGQRIEEILAGPNQEKILDSLAEQGLRGDELDLAFMAKLSAEEKVFQDLYRQSVQFARYQTFTDDIVSPVGKGLADIHRANPAVRLIVPFYRTPANLLSYAAERSPIFFTAPNFWRSMEAGGAARDEAMARAVIGTSVAAWAISAVNDGTLTGAGPPNPQLKKVYQEAGWKPYTLNGLNYDRLDPIATQLAVIADMADAYRYATSDKQREHLLVVMTASLAEAMGDKTFLIGIADVVDALSAAQSGGDTQFMAKMLASFVPYSSAMRSARSAMDPERRMTQADSFWGGVWNYTRNTIPIPAFYDDLPPQVDFWGEPMASQDFIGPDILSPFFMAKYQDDGATYALAQNGVAPGRVPCEVTIPGSGVAVDLHQLDIGKPAPWACHEYQQLVGQQRKMAVEATVRDARYRDLPVGAPQNAAALTVTRGDLLTLALADGKRAGDALFMERYRTAIEAANLAGLGRTRPVSPAPEFIERGRDAARERRSREPQF